MFGVNQYIYGLGQRVFCFVFSLNEFPFLTCLFYLWKAIWSSSIKVMFITWRFRQQKKTAVDYRRSVFTQRRQISRSHVQQWLKQSCTMMGRGCPNLVCGYGQRKDTHIRPKSSPPWLPSAHVRVTHMDSVCVAHLWLSCPIHSLVRLESVIIDCMLGISLAVQWLRLHASNAGAAGLILGRGSRSHMPYSMVKINK